MQEVYSAIVLVYISRLTVYHVVYREVYVRVYQTNHWLANTEH